MQMLRGLLSGFFWGAILSVGGLAALSVHDSMRKRPAPVPVSVAVPAGSEFNSKREDRQANLSPSENAPIAPAAMPSALPSTAANETADPVLNASQDTAIQPTTQNSPSALPTAPTEETNAPQIAALPPEKPNLSLENIKRPEKPMKENIAVAPQMPQQPQLDTNEDVALPTAPVVPSDPIETPTFGNTETQSETKELEVKEPETKEAEVAPLKFVDDPEMPAYREFGAADIILDGKPMLSIILIDDAQRALGPDAISGLAFPVSIAIDPASPDVFEHGLEYLNKGFDVLAHGGFAQNPTAQDIATGAEGILKDMPYTIGFLEQNKGSLQSSREAVKQLSTSAVLGGQGIVVHDKGFNPAISLADKAGVPALVITTDIDGAGQNISAIRRQLDGAAFKARQKGAVVLLGRLKPDTVTALLQWSLQSRAQSVAIVPVSQQMREMMKN
jgi:polysaccharide deacetylase 2 family uncharacterized protein YibQ